jgi:7-carboxy-7-deazaguanine synthase
MILTISEVVSSICTKGKFVGYPTTYIKLQGCNLSCRHCGIKSNKRKRMSVSTIMNYITKMGNEHVIITGGEPLLQESVFVLVYDLVDRGYKVQIETNGSIEIEDTLYKRSYSYSMGIKCPSTGMSNKINLKNLNRLMAHDELRVAIGDIEDYYWAKELLKKYPNKADVVLTPIVKNGKHIGNQLAQWLLEDKLPRTRIAFPI